MLSCSDLIAYQEKHDQQFPFLASRTHQTLDEASYPRPGYLTHPPGILATSRE